MECGKLMRDRDMYYGGRTEVFSAYAKSIEEDVVEHHDVTSMYPFVCAHKCYLLEPQLSFFEKIVG